MYVCILILFMYIHIFVLSCIRYTCTRIHADTFGVQLDTFGVQLDTFGVQLDTFGVQPIALRVSSNRIQFGV